MISLIEFWLKKFNTFNLIIKNNFFTFIQMLDVGLTYQVASLKIIYIYIYSKIKDNVITKVWIISFTPTLRLM